MGKLVARVAGEECGEPRDPQTGLVASGSFHQRRRDWLLPLFVRTLSPLPWQIVEPALGVIALARGLVDPSHRRRAFGWVASQPGATAHGRRLGLSLLFNEGRFVAMAALPATSEPESLRDRLVLRGLENLPAGPERVGTILLGFHLGPSVTSLAVCATGHPLISAGDTDYLAWPPPRAAWRPILRSTHTFVRLVEDASCIAALYRLRRLLIEGKVIRLAADARTGSEAFRIPLPGGEMVVRRMWWALRRQTRAVVAPVLAHCEGSRIVVTIHTPLPPLDSDPIRDLEACYQAVTAIVQDYVRRFPDQCLSLAFKGRRQAQTSIFPPPC